MKISELFTTALILLAVATSDAKKKRKHKYKVVTPAPVCVQEQESVFSVTGFLTFVVVSATAVSNVIANIDNNNNNNNNNDNNDNVNNNNQISDSATAENMGNARAFNPFRNCVYKLICRKIQRQDSIESVSSLGFGFSVLDYLCEDPLQIIDLYRFARNSSSSCARFDCDNAVLNYLIDH